MSSDAHLVALLLHHLAEDGQKDTNSKEARARTKLLTRLHSFHPHFAQSGLEAVNALPEKLGRAPVNFFKDNSVSSFITLRPVVKGDSLLPLVSMVADKDLEEFRLFLLVVTEDDRKNRVRSLGFRFESPEGYDGEEGRHKYWHVQPTSSFHRSGGPADLPSPKWLPTSTPAIPLDAQSPSGCVVCLMVSLYGGYWTAEVLSDLKRKRKISNEHVERLRKEVRALP